MKIAFELIDVVARKKNLCCLFVGEIEGKISLLIGTIYTAAEEIEAVGGRALPCVVDVRDEDAVGAAIESAVAKFGGLDILVNNASAIALKGTLDVDMKRWVV